MTLTGVTAAGFVIKRQSDIISEINASLAAVFGKVNVSAQSNLGVLTGILSEREALLWELAEAVYNSAFATGAEGAAVDNILALAGMTRLAASATRTNPDSARAADGTLQHGLVLFGTAGTIVPAGSLVRTAGASPTSFSLDSSVTIQPAQNAQQSLILSRAADSGSLVLSLSDGTGGAPLSTTAIAAPVVDSAMQAAIRTVRSTDSKLRFSDVTVVASGTVFDISFGATTPVTEGGVLQPSSGAKAQPLIAIASSTLTAAGPGGSTIQVNTAVVNVVDGAPAQGAASATCTTTGPIAALAHTITVIGTPLSGWTGVDNQLDCIEGADAESDAAALARMASNRALNGNGTDGAIEAHVAAVPGVLEAKVFANVTNCAVQVLSFMALSGTYQIHLGQGTTAPIAYNATAAAVQAAINAIAGYKVVVSGSPLSAMTIDYNGSFGGQPQPLVAVTVSDPVLSTILPSYGRPPKSFEAVVDGGADVEIATAILASMPAGIAAYGAPSAVVNGQATAGSTTLLLAASTDVTVGNIVTGPGVPSGTTVSVVNSGSASVQLSQAATLDTFEDDSLYTFSVAVPLKDSQGNPIIIAFSRPLQILPYVAVALLTDYYNTPGVSASGTNTQAAFSPSSIATIQQDLVNIGNSVGMGGLIVAQGSKGLVGAFNDVPGVLSYGMALAFGTRAATPSATAPTVPANMQLLPQQKASFEVANVDVSWA